MRVALLTHDFGPIGGVPAVATGLRDVLLAAGDRVTVFNLASSMRDRNSRRILSPSTWRSAPVMRRDVEAFAVGANWVELEPMRYRPRRMLEDSLREYDVALLVAGTPTWMGVLREAPIPVALQVATTLEWERESRLPAMPLHRRLPAKWFTRYLSRREPVWLRRADVVLVENEMMYSWARAQEVNVRLLPPGVDTNRFTPRSSAGSRARLPLVSVGRLGEARKGWDRLIRGYATYRSEVADPLPLKIAGKGELALANQELIRRLDLQDHIVVLRDVSPANLVVLLQNSSVFLQTSHEEGLGLAGLEAMACGLPVVATETAGSLEYVSSETGSLVSNRQFTPDEFSSALQSVIESLETKSVAARRTVMQQFSAQAVGEHFRTEILELVRSSG